MADTTSLQRILDGTQSEKSVKAQAWDDVEASIDRDDLSRRLSQSKLPAASQKLLLNLKFPETGQPPPKFGPGPLQPAEGYPQGHLTGREIGGMAVGVLPTGAAMVGGAFGGVPGAALAGMAGEALRQNIVGAVGPERLSGPTIKTEAAPSTFSEVTGGLLKEGVTQGAFQAGGSVISKVFRGLIGGPFHAASELPENAAVKEVAKKYNLNLGAGRIAQKGKTFQKIGELGLWAQSYIQKKWGGPVVNGMKAINGLLGRLMPPTSPTEAGQATQGMFKVSNDLFRQEASRLYWNLDQEAAGVMVDATSIKMSAVAKLQQDALRKATHPNTGGYGSKTLKLLEDAAGQPDLVPFKVAHDWRSNLLKITPQPDELMAGELPGIAKQLVRDVTGTMEASADALNPTAKRLWVEARKFYKDGAALFDHETITGLMSKDPDMVVKAIESQRVDLAGRVRKAILDYPMQYGNPAERQEAQLTWRQFQEQFIRTHILTDPEHTGVDASVWKLADIKERINKMGPGVMNEIMGSSPVGADVLKNLAAIGELFSRVEKLPPSSRMAIYRIMEASMVFAGGVLVHPVAGLTTIAALESLPRAISSVVYNKKATGYMLDGIGGLLEAIEKKPIQALGRGAVRIQNRTVNAPRFGPRFSQATANLMRAGKLVQEDMEKMQRPSDSGEPPPEPPAKAGPMTIDTRKGTMDLFKDWR